MPVRNFMGERTFQASITYSGWIAAPHDKGAQLWDRYGAGMYFAEWNANLARWENVLLSEAGMAELESCDFPYDYLFCPTQESLYCAITEMLGRQPLNIEDTVSPADAFDLDYFYQVLTGNLQIEWEACVEVSS